MNSVLNSATRKSTGRNSAAALISGLLVAFTCAQPLSAAEQADPFERLRMLNQQLDVYREQISDLESEYDAYYPGIQEPLSGMVSLLIESGDYEQVVELQNRQLQLARSNLGLIDLSLIPLLEEIAANQLRLGDWVAVSDSLEHIRYVIASQPEPDVEQQLLAMDRQAQWFMSRVHLDGEVRSFFQGRQVYEQMVSLAEETYGENSLEMINWLYKEAYNIFQLVELLNARGRFGSDAIDRLIREDGQGRLQSSRGGFVSVGNAPYWGPSVISQSPLRSNSTTPIIDSGSRIGEKYLREGLNIVTRIEDLLDEGDDAEAKGMSLIYHGDYQVLVGIGLANRSYRQAKEQLLEAGLDESRIELFFNTPTLIPAPEYFTRLEDAIAHQQGHSMEIADDAGQISTGMIFTAWSEDLPSTSLSIMNAPFLDYELQYDQVEFEFNLSRSSRITSVDILSVSTDNRSVRRRANRAIRDIKFRPSIVQGETNRVRNLRLRYLFPVEQQ
jgi:hypothetical protein